jgi:SAM-dependent methyltransferase
MTASGNLDLRLKYPEKVQLFFDVGQLLFKEEKNNGDYLPMNKSPQNNFTDIDVPHHLSNELISYFPKVTGKNTLMLDLGCGDAIHREICEHAGFEYVGLDYADPKAPIWGDAHSLPFKNNSFDFILSIAVLEHIRFPFVMIREAYRVLKEGGVFVGTVSFLEPFHGNSYYHYTSLGLYNMLRYGGFTVDIIAPGKGWQVFDAQARMASWVIFPGMPKFVSTVIIRLPQLISDIWWKGWTILRSENKPNRNMSFYTGSFCFVAKKGISE